jgi:hypothetical protein
MGIKISARPMWEPEDTPGPAKLKLVKFFAQHRNEEQVSFLTAFDLIDIFYKRHPRKFDLSFNLDHSNQANFWFEESLVTYLFG